MGLGRRCQEELARAAYGTFQILAPMGAVNVSSMTFPVFRTPAGSNTITSASSSAAVRCSTPRGTTTNSPGPSSTFLSRNSKAALPDQKQFVYVIVVVPRESPLHFDQLDLLAVQLGHNLGLPLL